MLILKVLEFHINLILYFFTLNLCVGRDSSLFRFLDEIFHFEGEAINLALREEEAET